MLQPFDSSGHDNFLPLPLNNYSKKMRKDDTNFLTFNKPQPSYIPVEFAKGANDADWAVELDDTFAKEGVWDFRYEDVANPYAAGYVYNRDMGGPDIFKTEPDNSKSKSEYMGADNKKILGMRVVKKEKAGVAPYVSKTVDKYDSIKPASYDNRAYEKYGYKEMGIRDEDQGGAEMAMFMRNKAGKNTELRKKMKEKETAVFKRDAEFCPVGHTLVDGICIPTEPRANPVCPYGWELNKSGRCQLAASKEFMGAVDGTTTSDALNALKVGKSFDPKRNGAPSRSEPALGSPEAQRTNEMAKHTAYTNNMIGSDAAYKAHSKIGKSRLVHENQLNKLRSMPQNPMISAKRHAMKIQQ